MVYCYECTCSEGTSLLVMDSVHSCIKQASFTINWAKRKGIQIVCVCVIVQWFRQHAHSLRVSHRSDMWNITLSVFDLFRHLSEISININVCYFCHKVRMCTSQSSWRMYTCMCVCHCVFVGCVIVGCVCDSTVCRGREDVVTILLGMVIVLVSVYTSQ